MQLIRNFVASAMWALGRLFGRVFGRQRRRIDAEPGNNEHAGNRERIANDPYSGNTT